MLTWRVGVFLMLCNAGRGLLLSGMIPNEWHVEISNDASSSVVCACAVCRGAVPPDACDADRDVWRQRPSGTVFLSLFQSV